MKDFTFENPVCLVKINSTEYLILEISIVFPQIINNISREFYLFTFNGTRIGPSSKFKGRNELGSLCLTNILYR